jgi:3-isopropylmalate dehydrogenase
VVAEAVKVLEAIFVGSPEVELKLETHLFGGCAIDELGEALPATTLQACKEADAILMGTSKLGTLLSPPFFKLLSPTVRLHRRSKMGRQQQSAPRTRPARPPQGPRPLREHPPRKLRLRLAINSPLKESITRGVDIIVVRELIGGIYFGERKEQNVPPQENVAWDTMIYSVEEVQRITRVAAQIALASDPPLPIHSIDKANVLASSRLWRKVVTETLTSEYPQIKLEHQLVDSAAMFLVANPRKLNGVVLTGNLFGDM